MNAKRYTLILLVFSALVCGRIHAQNEIIVEGNGQLIIDGVRIQPGVQIQGLNINVQGGDGRINVQGAQGRAVVRVRDGQAIVTDDSSPSAPPRPSPPPPEPGQGQVSFLNGDRLMGSLLTISGEPLRLVWAHPAASEPISFTLEGLDRVFVTPAETASSTNINTRVELTNNDVLEGRLVSLDKEYFRLETAYAGLLNIERVMVARFFPNLELAGVLYEGPRALDEWNFPAQGNAPAWRLRNGRLHALQQMPITRTVQNWPELCVVEFDASWRSYPSFNFTVFGEESGQVMRAGYMVQVSGNSVYFRRYSPEQGTANMWNVNVPELANNRYRTARFRLFVDRKQGAFTLMINDQVIKQWTDPNGFAGQGDALQFRPLSLNGFSIGGIRIARWNGVVPNLDKTARRATTDFLQFANRDHAQGELLSIEEGTALFRNGTTDLKIPVERISEVELAPEESERARRNRDDVRVGLANGVVLTLKLARLEDGTLHGSSENFGEATLPAATIRQLDFNIYSRRAQEEEPEESE